MQKFHIILFYAVDVLRDAGYHARALKGGYPAWDEAGFPIDQVVHSLPQHWASR